MTKAQPIKELFANDIHRRIEEVIKVDQTDEEILRDELNEYVVTDAIQRRYTEIFERYLETPNKPHEGIAIWISGFFGSGKSSFAKMLGLTIENRQISDKGSTARFSERTGDNRLKVVLKNISEKIPTHAVIFDVSTDRGIRSGNQRLTEIMYGLFLQSLGYAKDLDLSELEIALEERGELAKFEAEYRRTFNRDWNVEKGKVAFALGDASRIMHQLQVETYPMADSWVKAVKNRSDITANKLAERIDLLMKRRRGGQNLLFVADEVGQFVARDVDKMLDLAGIVQALGRVGRGKYWIAVTSQEKLNELVSGLDDRRIELARLMDRFPLQAHLEPSDISEVTSRRVLTKNAPAEAALGKLFDDHRGRLTEHTRLTADIRLPELSRDNFVDLYPLLPYQIDLIIQVVSGLRTQGGASKHVGGANRTIIKLAQQLLINPSVDLASRPVGDLVRLDQVYDLVEGNIGSEVRAKISAIPRELKHPMAQSVAKAICLLQYVKSVHRTAENISAALHPGIAADSQLASVKEALRELELTHKVRQGDDGYRIPTPAEDDWERVRNGMSPKPGESHRLQSDIIAGFWQPQPSHTLLETKAFKAGLAIHGRDVTDGDLMFHIHLADDGDESRELAEDLRKRSQTERKHVFWAVALNDAIDRETVELFRSKEMLARKEREARTADETALITEERVRMRRHQDELKRLVKLAALSGSVYFRGNDRSPRAGAADVGKSVAEILADVLPDVFERFKDAAARLTEVKKGTEALYTAENLHGLPNVFSTLSLLREEKGKTVFAVDRSPLAEVLRRIEERANYGETANGRFLADEFAKEPYGWEFDTVRLLVLSLLRAGEIAATSKGQPIESATGLEARDTFSNNNVFKQAAFRPKTGGPDFAQQLQAAEAFKDTFGSEIREITVSTIVQQLRAEIARHEDQVSTAHAQLLANRLPGANVLAGAIDEMKTILRGSEENAIATFNASHRSIKDAIKRAGELESALSETRLADIQRARHALDIAWPFLRSEVDITDELRKKAEGLTDVLARETFYRELASIDQHASALQSEFERRYAAAVKVRAETYAKALDELKATPGWGEIDEAQREKLAAPLAIGTTAPPVAVPIPQLRSEREACSMRLSSATTELRRIIDGERIVTLNFRSYFAGGIETEEQLEAALQGIREECARLIGAGKKVIIQ